MAVETAATHLEDMPVVDVAQLTDYEQMKGKLAIEVVSLEANSDMLFQRFLIRKWKIWR